MKLNIVVALVCEAKPIIQALKLKKDVNEHIFQIYHNAEKSLCLIISGIGKINAVAATTYLALYHKTANQGFLNIGCAGGNFPIGNMYAASKISQVCDTKAYYPKINFLKNIAVNPLETYDVAVSEYPENIMVDMEAYGFYQSAIKFASQEFIQAIKIISDNSLASMQAINREIINELIESQLVEITAIIKNQLNLLQQEQQQLNQAKLLSKIVEKFHISQQQTQQLERLLQRAELFFNSEQIDLLIKTATSSQAIIKSLDKQLAGCF